MQRMLTANLHDLTVVEGETVVGVLSEHDAAVHAARFGANATVAAAMQTPLVLSPDDDRSSVIERLQHSHADTFPVEEDGRLAGIVTAADVAALILREERVAEPLEQLVGEIMTRNPEVAHADDAFVDVVSRMYQRGVRHLPVVDAERRVIAMLSDRDVRSAVGELFSFEPEERVQSMRLEFLKVADVVHRAPITVPVHAPVSQLVRILVDQKIGAVPVVDDHEHLVGIVSYLDVLSHGPWHGGSGRAVQPGHERGHQPG
jgi:acetoin utilization protein AcuB